MGLAGKGALITPDDVVAGYPSRSYTLPSLLASRVRVLPDKPFIVFDDQYKTYAQFAVDVEQAARWLNARGIEQGDRVAVFSGNHPSTVTILFALAHVGAIMVPINPAFGVMEARYVLQDARVQGVICAAETLEIAWQACKDMELAPWLVQNEAGADDRLPCLQDEIARTFGPIPPVVATPETTCVFIYTSGTTGSPKGAMHSQQGYVVTAEAFVVRLFLQPDDRMLCVLPLFHINALFYSVGGALAAGATVVLVRRFSAGNFWATVEQSGATTVNLIGAAASILSKRERSEFRKGHRMTKAFIAPLDEALVTAFKDEFNVQTLIECYGMTEIPGVLSNPFLGPHKLGSMGIVCRHLAPHLPQPEVRIVDEKFHDVAIGQQGQLLVRTPTLMQGYYRDPERTASAFHDGWFMTGDIAWQDDDGFLWFVARQKDIIRRRGENISGAEIDRIISAHASVLEAAAIGVPSELGEEEILAVVVPRPGKNMLGRDIKEWVGQHLSAVKIPRYVVFVDELPKTATQRVEKFKLKQDPELLARAKAFVAGA
jgi:crotonobetaine/carnitine-CoA ligase